MTMIRNYILNGVIETDVSLARSIIKLTITIGSGLVYLPFTYQQWYARNLGGNALYWEG